MWRLFLHGSYGWWLWLAWPGMTYAAGTPLQFKAEENAELPWGATLMLALLALVALCLLAMLRRPGGRGTGKLLRWLPRQSGNATVIVSTSRRLEGKAWLHVVEWEGGKVLFAINDQQIVMLDRRAVDVDPGQELQ